MSTLLKPREHFASFNEMLDIDRFFGNAWLKNAISKTFPMVNIRETEKSYIVDFAVPGFKKEDFKIHVEGDTLTVSAQRQEEKKETKESYTRREFSFESFSRSFTMPQSADHDHAEAAYENGILTLSIAKRADFQKNGQKEISVK